MAELERNWDGGGAQSVASAKRKVKPGTGVGKGIGRGNRER